MVHLMSVQKKDLGAKETNSAHPTGFSPPHGLRNNSNHQVLHCNFVPQSEPTFQRNQCASAQKCDAAKAARNKSTNTQLKQPIIFTLARNKKYNMSIPPCTQTHYSRFLPFNFIYMKCFPFFSARRTTKSSSMKMTNLLT